MKKVLLEVLQMLAMSAFVGISLYGVFMYWGGETHEKIPASQSLLLGLAAVICVIVFITIGGLLDRIAAAGQAGSGTEQKDNG
jgi:formate hydrogenlyase subunit 3/multisubunit Na+/H+ antiporter MnhD subunit